MEKTEDSEDHEIYESGIIVIRGQWSHSFKVYMLSNQAAAEHSMLLPHTHPTLPWE